MNEIAILTGLRVSIGASVWAKPALTGRLFGLDAVANPQLPYVARLFGARDAALAAGLGLSDRPGRRLWLQLGIVCDAADAVAGILAGRAGELSKVSTALVTAPALMGVGLGVAALRADGAAAPGETGAPGGVAPGAAAEPAPAVA